MCWSVFIKVPATVFGHYFYALFVIFFLWQNIRRLDGRAPGCCTCFSGDKWHRHTLPPLPSCRCAWRKTRLPGLYSWLITFRAELLCVFWCVSADVTIHRNTITCEYDILLRWLWIHTLKLRTLFTFFRQKQLLVYFVYYSTKFSRCVLVCVVSTTVTNRLLDSGSLERLD